MSGVVFVCLFVAFGGGAQVEKQRKDGLIENHAYSIIKAVSLHGEKLIQIRNPWVRTFPFLSLASSFFLLAVVNYAISYYFYLCC